MKKKLTLVTLLLTCLCLLCGCVRSSIEMEVKSNGKMNLKIMFAMQTEGLQGMGNSSNSGMNDQAIEEYKRKGYDVSEYKQDGYEGFVISKENFDPKDLQDNEGGSGSGSGTIDQNIKIETNSDGNYEINIPVGNLNPTGQQGSNAEESKEMAETIKKAGGYMNFVLVLPDEPVKCNATKQEGNRLTWDMLSPDTKSISVEYKLPFWAKALIFARENTVLVIFIAAFLLILIALLVVLLVRKHRKKNQFDDFYSMPFNNHDNENDSYHMN